MVPQNLFDILFVEDSLKKLVVFYTVVFQFSIEQQFLYWDLAL
jgi:hypothetical protein